MSGVTGIELGPDYCVLVRGGGLGSHRTVSAASAIMPAEWPAEREALVERLREIRRRDDLYSRARVVAWGDGTTLAPLTEAGFEIVSVLSPAQALARAVRTRQSGAEPGTAVAALSLNSHGAAIAIVAGTDIVCTRAFDWPLGAPFRGARSELLDRYLLVSQIAPQLQHVIDLVRPAYGVTVTSVVACGNLSNLRSLAMLLIEELDLEVETLDSAELLEPGVAPGLFGDSVASLQLAAAVASSPERRVPIDISETGASAAARVDEASTHVNPKTRGDHFHRLASVAALACCTVWSFMQVSGSSPASPIFPGGLPHVAVADAAPAAPEPQVEATTGRDEPARRGSASTVPLHLAPLPSVDGIMIAGSRRLAIVGGNVVAPGDPVGGRAIARIERDGVVLREPSGREIYVAIRPRKPPPSVRERL